MQPPIQIPVYRAVNVGRGLGPAARISCNFTAAASRRPTMAYGIRNDKSEIGDMQCPVMPGGERTGKRKGEEQVLSFYGWVWWQLWIQM